MKKSVVVLLIGCLLAVHATVVAAVEPDPSALPTPEALRDAAQWHGGDGALAISPDALVEDPGLKALTTVGDSSGDATWGRGDIVAAGVGLDSSTVFVAVSTVLFSTPGSTPWRVGTTGILWELDVQGDGSADYEVFYLAPNGTPSLAVRRSSTGASLCTGVALYDAATSTYYGGFVPSCIGSPSRVYWRAFMAFTDAGLSSTDYAPNAGWAGPERAPTALPLPPGPPIGSVDTAAGSIASVRVSGWVIEPESVLPATVHVYVDGSPAGVAVADKPRGDIASLYPTYGSAHGFDVTVPAAGGPHNVCVYGINSGVGGNTLLGCRDVTTPSGPPVGAVDALAPTATGIRVSGWALDPDVASAIDVHVYVGAAAAVTTANRPRADIASLYPGYGVNHGFQADVAAAPGAHQVCVYAINLGAGGNTTLKCAEVTVPSPPPLPPSPVPARCTAPGAPPPVTGAPVSSATRFVPLDAPTRLFDTRADGEAGYVCPQQTITKQVRGRAGVPETAVAVAFNLTAVAAGGEGYVSVFPTGGPLPSTSVLNLTETMQTRPNMVIVPLGASGEVSLYVQSGAHLLADVAGYFEPVTTAAAGRFTPLDPARILDTRVGNGASGKLAANQAIDVQVTGRGVPANATAVALNLTGTDAIAPGYVTAWPTGKPRPNSSNVNLSTPGATAANLVIVPLGAGGRVSLYAEAGAHLLADVFGYFTDDTAPSSTAGLFVPLAPSRVFDTRSGAPVAARTSITRSHVGIAGVPASGVSAVMLNVTGTQAAAPGYITAWPATLGQPSVSSLNLARQGDTRANAVLMPITGQGAVSYFSESGAHLIADTFGYFTA
jgi:hypothetical protein